MRASERLLLVALLLAAPVVQADYKQSYARGKEAAEAGRWAEVATRMREAMAEQAEPQARVRIYGMRFEPYVPQFYLGLAAYRQGNCNEAVRSWQDAATASIVAGDGALKGIVESGLADCRRKLGGTLAQQPAASPTTPAATSPAATSPAANTPTAPATSARVASQPPASTPTPSAPPAATPARPTPTNAPPASAPVVSTPPRPTTAPPSAAPAATPAKPPAGSAPPALVAALDGYLAGRIEQAASLDLGGLNDPRARYHALLLRSAARHTLSQAGGERGEALLAAAQADIRAARALAPTQQPDAALFSPRYRRLYDATR